MIEINSLDHEGRGIGKLNNKIVFVENALPSEIVDIRIINEKKNYIEANVSSYIKKSNIRIKPQCPFYEYCGGCDIMHISYSDQLKFKKDKIRNIIDKYLNKDIRVNNIVKSDTELFYRNKTTFQVKNNIGLYKKNSYEIIPIDKCIITNNKINDAIEYLKKLDLKYINKIICKTNGYDLMIIIETNNKDLNINPIKDIATSIYLKIKNEYILVYGNKNIYYTLDNYKYVVSPDSFFQVNNSTCLKLYNKIKNYVGTNKNILDLYCGTGSIGIFISEDNNVIGIEINESAIKDANINKEINNIDNIKFICGDSGKKINNLIFNPDIIIVDPPRSGLNNETINNILKFKAKEIIYVSCDPMTLIRDLRIFNEYYDILEITPFDMFPNTKHIETITHLKRKM